MKNEPSKKPAAKQDKPHCRSCGGTDIGFTYTETMHGTKINEKTTIRSACWYLGEAIAEAAASDGRFDPNIVSNMSLTMVELAAMIAAREETEEATATHEAQS